LNSVLAGAKPAVLGLQPSNEEVKSMSPKVRALRNVAMGLSFAAFLVTLSISLAFAAPPPQSAAEGEAIFKDKCAGCHTIGGGKLAGPDLKGVTQQRDPQWLARFIAQPDKVLASGDPIAASLFQQFNNIAMPNLGLAQNQVAALVAYLGAQGGTGGGPSSAQATAGPLPAGDSTRGEALFMGTAHLHGGGPPCMGCHNIDSAGLLGGGVMGPDLTQAVVKYGEAGLASALATLPFPTMKPIFTDHPLTAEEQADLYAFIQTASGLPQANREAPVLALSLAGFIAGMILAGLVWRQRSRGVRRPLVKRGRTS
jgi:mono/diheme cytochrome c family protein